MLVLARQSWSAHPGQSPFVRSRATIGAVEAAHPIDRFDAPARAGASHEHDELNRSGDSAADVNPPTATECGSAQLVLVRREDFERHLNQVALQAG